MIDNNLWFVEDTVTSADSVVMSDDIYNLKFTVTKLEKPIGKNCKVHILLKDSGHLFYSTVTNDESFIFVPNLSKKQQYVIVAVDSFNIFNSVTFDLNFEFTQDIVKEFFLETRSSEFVSKILNIEEYPLEVFKDDATLILSDTFAMSSKNTVTLSKIGNPSLVFLDGLNLYSLVKDTDYLSIRSSFFRATEPFSISCTFNLLRGTTKPRSLLKQENMFSFYIDRNNNLIFEKSSVTNSQPVFTLRSLSKIDFDTTYHICLSFDGFTFYLFINGELDSTLDDRNGIPFLNSSILFGKEINGYLGNIQVHNVCKNTSSYNVDKTPYNFKKPNTLLSHTNAVLDLRGDKGYLYDCSSNVCFDNFHVDLVNYFPNCSYEGKTIASYKYFDLLSKDFTFKFNIRIESLSDTSTLISNMESTTYQENDWKISIERDGKVSLNTYLNNSLTTYMSATSVLSKEQVEICFTKNRQSLNIFINGFLDKSYVLEPSFVISNRTLNTLSISRGLEFNLYEFVVLKNICIYTTDYIPSLIKLNDVVSYEQYLVLNLPFKNSATTKISSLQPVIKNIVLSKERSVYNTYSAYFDGTSSYILTSALQVFKEDFTLELNISNKQETGIQSLLSIYNTSSTLLEIFIQDNRLYTKFNNVITDLNTTFKDNSFKHIVVQRTKTSLKVLIDGMLSFSGNVPGTLPEKLNIVFGKTTTNTNFLKAFINNLSIFKNINKYSDNYVVPTYPNMLDFDLHIVFQNSYQKPNGNQLYFTGI